MYSESSQSLELLVRLRRDFARILGPSNPPARPHSDQAETPAFFWVAGREGIRQMSPAEFHRWR